jgi:hypothetical protein
VLETIQKLKNVFIRHGSLPANVNSGITL